ncbi:hypothetical protein Q2T41_09230 [Maribacter confluentis]|uniref:Uncharacterized protein n=1 Tax=Maribacter confluentis TaxID=1656093 RepID=A0ABT8RPS2_9FLAO|nr:hypothetical protein [Maribacter confluentis]MDO1512835.1 hypothetical protein [Maribacter confluentis]
MWHKKYNNLEVYPIAERSKETYYWIAILFSNSFGTALGDYLTDVIGLSYLNGALITAGIIILVIMLHFFTKINQIVLFWMAFIFTRPFGTTLGDFLTKLLEKGGLDLGTHQASIVSMLLMGAFVFISHRNLKINPSKVE